MPCIPCLRHNRLCDETPPVCRTCRTQGEIFCSWITPDPNTSRRNPQGPHLPFLWLRESPEANLFFSTAKTKHLYKSDPELQEIFSLVNPQSDVGQVQIQAALAILSRNLHDHSPHWIANALEKYQAAFTAVNSLFARCSETESWKDLGVILSLINIYERHDCDFSHRYVHLTGLRTIVEESPSCGAHLGAVPCHVVKSLMYYTAIGSTFSFSQVAYGPLNSSALPNSYVSDIAFRLLTNPSGHGCQRLGLIAGVPVLIFGIIFQTAHARHASAGAPPAPELAYRLGQMKQLLETDVELIAEAQRPVATLTPPDRLKQMFRAACLVLLSKVMNPRLGSNAVQEIISGVWPILSSSPIASQAPAVAWPLLVLFFAAPRGERDYIRDLLEQHRLLYNMERHRSMITYLEKLEQDQADDPDNDALFDLLLRDDVEEITLL